MYPKTPRFIFQPGIELIGEGADEEATRGISNFDCGATVEEVIRVSRTLNYEAVSIFDEQMQRFYCATTFEPAHGAINLPAEWVPHVHLFVHNHPDCDETFSPTDLEAVHSLGCANALIISQNFFFLLEKLPRDWEYEAPECMKTASALKSHITNLAANWCGDPCLDYDHAIECMVLRLHCDAGCQTKYTVFDANGKVIISRPGPITIDQMLHYHDVLHAARSGFYKVFPSKLSQKPAP